MLGDYLAEFKIQLLVKVQPEEEKTELDGLAI